MSNEKTIELRLSPQEAVELKRALELHSDVLNDTCLESLFLGERESVSAAEVVIARTEISDVIDRLMLVTAVLERINHHV